MKKVKAFCEYSLDSLENAINEFLENEEVLKVHDIKFSMVAASHSGPYGNDIQSNVLFSALVYYEGKIEPINPEDIKF